MVRNTTEKERKEVLERTEKRGTAQPYASELEDRAAEHSRKKQESGQEAPAAGAGVGDDASEGGAK